jgi:hypothetical protein
MTSFLHVVNYYDNKLYLNLITKMFHVHFQNYCGRSRMATVRKRGGLNAIPFVVRGSFLSGTET